MKIMFVTPSMRFGGAERVMSILSDRFIRKENEVTFVIMDDERTLAYPLDPSTRVEFMPTPRFRKPNDLFRLIAALRDIIREDLPDVVVSFFNSTALFAALALRKTGIPLVFSERNDPARNVKGVKEKLIQHVALSSAARIVFQTEGAKNYYGKKYRRKADVILNPLDIDKLPKDRDQDLPREKRIVSVGRLNPQKNQALLLCAFEKIASEYPDHTLTIYGEGALRPALVALAEEKGIAEKTYFPGNSKQVLYDIQNAGMFAFTSDYEGLPNALIEAMAIGLPCVSTDCSPGGARELIRNGENGFLIPCNDEAALVNALRTLCADPRKAEEMGQKAREIRGRIEAGAIADRWLAVFHDLKSKKAQ